MLRSFVFKFVWFILEAREFEKYINGNQFWNITFLGMFQRLELARRYYNGFGILPISERRFSRYYSQICKAYIAKLSNILTPSSTNLAQTKLDEFVELVVYIEQNYEQGYVRSLAFALHSHLIGELTNKGLSLS